MSATILWLGPLLETAILTGLLVRHRLGKIATLPCMLIALIVSESVVGLCGACNTWKFWLVNEFAHAALLLALAVELILRVFPGPARRAAVYWLAFVMAVMTALVLTTPQGWLIVEVLPRVLGAIAWLYMGLMVVMLRYDVHIEPLHDAILSGFTPYLMVYAATWSQAATDTSIVKIVNPVMFVFVLLLLLRAAWQQGAPRTRPWIRRSYDPGNSEPPPSSSPRSLRTGKQTALPGLA